MSWQSIPLNEDTILTILAAVKVYNLEISPDDHQNLADAYQFIQDRKALDRNSIKIPIGKDLVF